MKRLKEKTQQRVSTHTNPHLITVESHIEIYHGHSTFLLDLTIPFFKYP